VAEETEMMVMMMAMDFITRPKEPQTTAMTMIPWEMSLYK
jgi:hypothetical protein